VNKCKRIELIEGLILSRNFLLSKSKIFNYVENPILATKNKTSVFGKSRNIVVFLREA